MTDKGVFLTLNVRLGQNLFFGLYPDDENGKIIDTIFEVKLKDGTFSLEYAK